jgi:hypothetical protein
MAVVCLFLWGTFLSSRDGLVNQLRLVVLHTTPSPLPVCFVCLCRYLRVKSRGGVLVDVNTSAAAFSAVGSSLRSGQRVKVRVHYKDTCLEHPEEAIILGVYAGHVVRPGALPSYPHDCCCRHSACPLTSPNPLLRCLTLLPSLLLPPLPVGLFRTALPSLP